MKNVPGMADFDPSLCAKHPQYDADQCPLRHPTDDPGDPAYKQKLLEDFHFGYCEADTKDGKVCNTELSPTGRCRNHMDHWNPAPAQASDAGWGKYRRAQRAQILEAVCGTCGETFIPNDEDDTIHGEREDGTECGGQGTITGSWS